VGGWGGSFMVVRMDSANDAPEAAVVAPSDTHASLPALPGPGPHSQGLVSRWS